MDSFETPYEDEASIEFIDCTICEKSIRGDTLYKIHLTTQGHIKKEDALVAAGHIVREHTVPLFEDILQYLEYLDLDEPIIGLSYLAEVPGNLADQHAGPRYTCKLCFMTTTLPDIVHHVIGRKHRQKYMELKRPDLVTWDKTLVNQGGKIIRARAEIIERQDGRGTPLSSKKRGTVGKSNISRVQKAPRWQQNRDRNISQSTQRERPPHPPGFKDYQDDYCHQGRGNRSGFSNTPSFHPDDHYTVNTDRQRYPREVTLSCDRMEKEPWRADYSESDMYRGQYMDKDGHGQYEDEYVEGPRTRSPLETDGVHMYDPMEEMPHGQAEYYPEEAPPYSKPYMEKDPLKEFYAQEVRNGQDCSAERQPLYPEVKKNQLSRDRESGRLESRNRAGGLGFSEPEAKRRCFPTRAESDQSHFMIDYQHAIREPYQEEAISKAGPSRTGPPKYQRPMEITRPKPEIPDPFKQFLKGSADVGGHRKRKRESRFSDATAKEMQNAKKMFFDDYKPPNPKFGGLSIPGAVPFEPEVRGTQQPDAYIEPQRLPDTNNYQRGSSEPGDVLDMLNNIEIENTEEAEFLKGKLCNLLKEFKAKKSQKNMQNIQGHAVISKDSNSLKSDMQLSQHHYERSFREFSDIRQPEELYVKEDLRRRVQEQYEPKPDERHQEYNSPVCGEPRRSNRSRYEEVFGRPEMYHTPPATHSNEPARYPERFRESLQPLDYQPVTEEFFDSRSAAPPLHMEQGSRMHRNPQYSNNLDKITSTLLELMSRKQS